MPSPDRGSRAVLFEHATAVTPQLRISRQQLPPIGQRATVPTRTDWSELGDRPPPLHDRHDMALGGEVDDRSGPLMKLSEIHVFHVTQCVTFEAVETGWRRIGA